MRKLPVGSQAYNEVRSQALAVKADNDQSLQILSQARTNSRVVDTHPNWNGSSSTTRKSRCPAGYHMNSAGECYMSYETVK